MATARSSAAKAPAASPAIPISNAKARSRTPTASRSSATTATPNVRASPASREPGGSLAERRSTTTPGIAPSASCSSDTRSCSSLSGGSRPAMSRRSSNNRSDSPRHAFSRVDSERTRSGMTAFEDVVVREAQLPQGVVRYRELGIGEPIVLVHGLLTNSLLWTDVATTLARDFRVIAPDWPLGSHERPLRPGTDLSPPGLARLIADLLAALKLEDVTLVGNDTGGALCQLAAVHHPERVARLV